MYVLFSVDNRFHDHILLTNTFMSNLNINTSPAYNVSSRARYAVNAAASACRVSEKYRFSLIKLTYDRVVAF